MPSETSPVPASADAAEADATVDAAAAVPAANSSRRLGRNELRRFLTEERVRDKPRHCKSTPMDPDERYESLTRQKQVQDVVTGRERTKPRKRSAAGVSWASRRQARPISRRA